MKNIEKVSWLKKKLLFFVNHFPYKNVNKYINLYLLKNKLHSQ